MENLKSEIFRDSIMNRQQRRQQERVERKEGKAGTGKTGVTQLEVVPIMPWADVLWRVVMPPFMIDALLDITDQVLQDPDRKNWGENLAGQIQDEPLIPHQLMMDYKVAGGTVFHWLMNVVGEYVKACSIQQATFYDADKMKDTQWLTQMKSAWVISQWEGEYNPLHVHTECAMSTVLYLKVPEFLPSTKPLRDDDGCIMFIGGAGVNSRLTRNMIKVKPTVGEFFIFPAHLQHCVYPFKTEGDQERRSISFNADFIDKASYDKQQEMSNQQQQQQAPAPVQQAPEKLTINTEM